MYTTKSFCNILAFLRNPPGVDSPIGEITTYGKTFSREVGYYHHTTLTGYDLVNLRSVDEGVAKQVPQNVVDQAIALVDICVQRTINTSGQHYENAIREELMENATRLGVSDISVGRMANNGTYWVPSSITWTDASAGAGSNVHRVWLAMEALENQYTDYTHIIEPPLIPLDQFFAAPSVVIQRLGAITPSQMMDRAQDARGGVPATVIRLPMFEYVDPSNPDRKVPSYWGIIINGPAGDNVDAIKDSLMAYVLANSNYPRSRWEEILPDIFKRTEFVHVPLFNRMARGASVLQHGIYSAVIPQGSQYQQQVAKNAVGYDQSYVLANAMAYNFPYRCLAVGVVGSPDNKDGKILFLDHFPDYMPIGPDGEDFGRMSDVTQGFHYKFITAVKQAESWYDGMDLEKDFYLVRREDVPYVGFTHENVQHLVATKLMLEV